MASSEDILNELARKTSIRPCPEVVWKKKVFNNAEYQVVDERNKGEEIAIISGSTTFGFGSGAGIKYTLKNKDIAIGSFIADIWTGAELKQKMSGGLGAENIAGYRELTLTNPQNTSVLLTPVVKAFINFNTGEVITEWDRSTAFIDRYISADYEYHESGIIKVPDSFVYHTGKTPYDLENSLAWGFVFIKQPRVAGSTIFSLKLTTYKDGIPRSTFESTTEDNSDMSDALISLMENIQDVEQTELYTWLTTSPSQGGVANAVISLSDSIIPPGTLHDSTFESNCSIEDYYIFDE